MYAILDIETTGGQFNEEGITEIAIYKFDGHQVVDQFISLVNPEIPIQPFVVKLTGINSAMLQSAPKFYEVAKRIIEITNDCILVAHNALFDYRILRTEFRRLGYDFQLRTLCTVELAQKLLPEQPSYSLGKLVRALGIPMADRHRANGDAIATVKLFELLLSKDLEKTIVKELIKTEVEKGMEPKLLDLVASLPSRTGVYYVHNEQGTIIHISRSKNMKKHLNQHFTGDSRISKQIQNEIFTVTYEETGTEIIAQLKESQEIAVNRPVYNKISRRKKSLPFALYSTLDANRYLNLIIGKNESTGEEIAAFISLQEGKNVVSRITFDYNFCRKLTGLEETEIACSAYPEKCEGACICEISPDVYNEKVNSFIERNSIESKQVLLVDRGRSLHERSALLMEYGVLKGYAFFDLNYQISNPEVLKNIIIPMPDTKDAKLAIKSYLVKNKGIKIISF